MKTYHVFHHNDADGYASAAVLNRFYLNKLILAGGDENDESSVKCVYYSCNHNYPMDLSDIENGDVVFILDYSFSREDDQKVLLRLEDKGCKVIWIDHHDTSHDLINKHEIFRRYAENGLVYTGTKYSAAMLTYIWCQMMLYDVDNVGKAVIESNNALVVDYFELISFKAPYWIKLVSDHDTFTHELDESTPFCVAVTHYGLIDVFLGDDGWSSYSDEDDDYAEDRTQHYIDDGKLLFDYQQNQNAQLFKRSGYRVKLTINSETYEIACFNGYGNSYVFGDTFEEVDGCAIFSYDGTAWRYSLFSHKSSNCDCGNIASLFNTIYRITGGGHFHAAGWSAPVNVFDPSYQYNDRGLKIVIEKM